LLIPQEDEEQGLAHFLEHMAFKGTTSFDTGALIKTMESIGVQYGQHLNASTSQDQTLYKLTVPLGDGSAAEAQARADLALTVLAEFASGMRISDSDVETERAVIEEERRQKNGASRRLLRKYWKEVFGGAAGATRHATRMPIGLSEVVLGVSPAAIRAFYEKWYRPSLMAVVVVGDLSAVAANDPKAASAWVQATLERAFGPIPGCGHSTSSGAAAPGLPLCPLPLHPAGRAPLCYHEDPELSQSQALIEFFEPFVTENSVAHIERDVARRLLTSLMDQRLGFIARNGDVDDAAEVIAAATATAMATSAEPRSKPSPPFLWAGVSTRPIIQDLLCTGVSATVASGPGALERGVEGLLTACQRAALHGFTAPEVAVAKHKWRLAFDAQRADATNRLSSVVVDGLVEHFNRRGALPCATFHDELDLCLAALERTTAADLNALAAETFSIDGMHVGARAAAESSVVGAPVSNNEAASVGGGERGRFRAVCLTRQTTGKAAAAVAAAGSGADEAADKAEAAARAMVARAIARVQAAELRAWPVKEPPPTALTAEPIATVTPVAPPSALAECGASELVLDNGLVVCVKRTPQFKRGQVAFQGFALGGSSELTEAQEAVRRWVVNYCLVFL